MLPRFHFIPLRPLAPRPKKKVLGTLNNLTALDLPKGIGWVDVLSNYALAPFLTKLLVPGMAQDDVVLEVSRQIGPWEGVHSGQAGGLPGCFVSQRRGFEVISTQQR